MMCSLQKLRGNLRHGDLTRNATQFAERRRRGRRKCVVADSAYPFDPSTAFSEISSESSALRSLAIASDEKAPRS